MNMRVNKLTYALAGCLLSFCGCQADWEKTGLLVLAERGKPAAYAIVLPKDASPSQRKAASELQEYVRRLTGVSLPIGDDRQVKRGIFLGNGAEELGPDGFRFVACPPHFRIEGGKVHGTLFGVYDFLERHAGCDWFSPKTSVIPEIPRLTVPVTMDETHKPAFEVRDMSWYENYHDDDLNAKLKLSGFRIKYPEEFGGMDRQYDCSTYEWTSDYMLPAKVFFDKHPDWYAEIDGKRRKSNTQLCLSNPEVVDAVTSNILKRISERYPAAKYYGIAQNDWWSYCTCKKCKAIDDYEGGPSGSIITFMNKVAERVEKKYPDVIVHTFAYMYSLTPPKHVRGRPNTMVTLCTDACDFSKPIPTNRWVGCERFRKNLDGWKKVAPRIYIWDYAASFQYVLPPFPCLEAAQGNMKYFLENGIRQLYEEGQHNSTHAADAELKNWVLAHLMWDPYQPLEPLLDRFFKGYYGAAASMAREYYDTLCKLPRDEKNAPMTMWGPLEDPVFTAEVFDKAAPLWGRAAEAVKDDPVRSENVRWARNAVDYMRIMRTTYAAPLTVTRHPEYVSSKTFKDLQATARRILTDFGREPVATKFSTFEGYRTRLEQLVKIDPAAVKASDVVEVEEDRFRFGGLPKPKIVADKLAENGKAYMIDPGEKPHYKWTSHFYLNNLRFDPGVRYHLRVRVRLDKTGVPGEAFAVSTMDLSRGERRQIPIKGFRAEDFGDGYQWVDVGDWTPEIEDSVWIALGKHDNYPGNPHPSVRGVYVDKIEISRR